MKLRAVLRRCFWVGLVGLISGVPLAGELIQKYRYIVKLV